MKYNNIKKLIEMPALLLGLEYEGDIFIVSYLHQLSMKPDLKRKYNNSALLLLSDYNRGDSKLNNEVLEHYQELEFFLTEVKCFEKEYSAVINLLETIMHKQEKEILREVLVEKYSEMTQCHS